MRDLDHQWHSPPIDLGLSSDEVHIWRATLERSATHIRQLAQTLSGNERVRAERFYFERDRRRFIVAHGVLRAILGRYLGIGPGQVQFCYGHRGKPYLSKRFRSHTLEFNVAHSHELVLYAITRGRKIGVDLEYVHPMPDIEQIATSFFSARENAALRSLPGNQKLEAFYNCWTRKEAYLKATGEGLFRPLDQFDVSLVPGEPARLLHVDRDPQETTRWSLQALRPYNDYVAAVVVQGHGWHLACWQWPDRVD